MDLLSDSSYHLQFEQTAFNRLANTPQIQPVFATCKFLTMKSFQGGRGTLKKIYPLNMDFPEELV